MILTIPVLPKQNNFNFIRLFCCFLVISMHVLDLSGTVSILRPIFDGHVAVCVFFILSGFWVTKSFLSSKNLKEYFVKRSIRILPLYYISVGGGLVAFAFASEFPIKEFFTNAETWKYLFWNCIFLNFMHPTLPGCFDGKFIAVNGALWTIKIEIAFYVVLPILIWFFKKKKSLKQLNISFLVLYVLSILYTFILSRYANALHLPEQLANQFPAFVSCFASGMFLFFNWDWILKKINLLIVPSVIIFALHYVLKTEFLMPISLSLICVFFSTRFTFLGSIGSKKDYSYPLYLFHFPLIQLMAHFNFYTDCFPLALFLTFAGTYFISVLAVKLVDALALAGVAKPLLSERRERRNGAVAEPRT